jgi:hypothetical protein
LRVSRGIDGNGVVGDRDWIGGCECEGCVCAGVSDGVKVPW